LGPISTFGGHGLLIIRLTGHQHGPGSNASDKFSSAKRIIHVTSPYYLGTFHFGPGEGFFDHLEESAADGPMMVCLGEIQVLKG
jgi:hypothetical protein